MERIYFKPQKQRYTKFMKFCEANGAKYFEDNFGIWIATSKYKTESFSAVALSSDGKVRIGCIDDGCDNFEGCSEGTKYTREERYFIIKVLQLAIKWKK